MTPLGSAPTPFAAWLLAVAIVAPAAMAKSVALL